MKKKVKIKAKHKKPRIEKILEPKDAFPPHIEEEYEL